MNVDGYNNESIERSKSVTGCFAMFLLFMSIMFLPAFYDGSKELLDKGYLYPLLFSLGKVRISRSFLPKLTR